MKAKVYSVFQINSYIKGLLEEDIILNGFFVEGEISNYKDHYSGHLYFTLKDERAAVQVVMFAGYAGELAFEPEDGMKVIVYGKASVYEKTGQMQVYAEIMEPMGIGGLYAAFEQLKKKLEKGGLFDQSHKKPIPQNSQSVCVITSPGGAAVRDIINIAKRRNPTVQLTLIPAQVQGEGAGEALAAAIAMANAYGQFDVIIIGRGGGSLEDLWAFNEEITARAIYNSKIPVISAVGHETDYTIADFVADLRAPTPSAAAEMATLELSWMKAFVEGAYNSLLGAMEEKLEELRGDLFSFVKGMTLNSPEKLLAGKRQALEDLSKSLNREMYGSLKYGRVELVKQVSLLEALSPLSSLKKGFALVEKAGVVVKNAGELKAGDAISLRFSDGKILARVSKPEDEGERIG